MTRMRDNVRMMTSEAGHSYELETVSIDDRYYYSYAAAVCVFTYVYVFV